MHVVLYLDVKTFFSILFQVNEKGKNIPVNEIVVDLFCQHGFAKGKS